MTYYHEDIFKAKIYNLTVRNESLKVVLALSVIANVLMVGTYIARVLIWN